MSSRSRDAKSSTQSAAEGGALSLRDITLKSRREADKEREQAEQLGFNAPRRWRRKIGRTEVISLRTFPEIKRMITQMADAEEKNLVEIIEDAIRLRHRSLKGS